MATTVTVGSTAFSGLRPELAELASRYLVEYGLGPNSLRFALKACATKPVAGDGMVDYLDKTWFASDHPADSQGVRYPGGNEPGHPGGTMTSINVRMHDYGKEVEWDDLQSNVVRWRAKGGDLLVEQKFTDQSMALCLQAIDYELAAKLAAASTPWDATDVSCSGMPWDGSTTHIADQIKNAMIGFGGILDSVVLTWEASLHFRTGMAHELGANVGGILDDAATAAAWAMFGIRNVYVADDNCGLSSYVNLYRKGSGDSDTDPAGLVLNHYDTQAGADQYGITVSTRKVGHRRNALYAYFTGDTTVIKPLGIRLTGTYS